MTTIFFRYIFKLLLPLSILSNVSAQTPTWTLWASGLPSGVYPKLWVAPNHDIFYGLLGGGTKGVIHKANTQTISGNFVAMPTIAFPSSVTNNVQTIITNTNNEPIVGIFRSVSSDPFLFRFDNVTNAWMTVPVDFPPNLGAFCNAIAPNGTIWIGTKWGYVYKSTNNGQSFTRIDETPIVQSAYPCYYPTWGGNPTDGAIYSINVDKNGRVYVGTEGAGIIYSDDEGVHWHPADYRACKASNSTQKDSASPMLPLTNTGNLGAIGFTASNNLIFNGTQMWTFNWNGCLGFADMTTHTVTQASGFMQYFIGTGLQVTKIVTTANGRIFLHSGSNASVAGTIGIYTSTDGINWSLFNTGITGINDGQSQGSLAVDGNMVYFATRDGKVFRYDATGSVIPIELIDFQGFNEGKSNRLAWRFADTKDLKDIGIQKSVDGKVFIPLSIKDKNELEDIDNTPFEVTYYRLKMNELNGDSHFSKTIAVKRVDTEGGKIKVYPNPVNDVLTIENAESKNIKIVNTLGQIILVENNHHHSSFNVHHLKSGVYFLKIGEEMIRFVKK